MPLAHSQVQVLNEESILRFNTYLSSTELLLILGTGLKNILKKSFKFAQIQSKLPLIFCSQQCWCQIYFTSLHEQ